MSGYFQAERDLLGSMGKDDALAVADFRVMMIAMRDSKLPGDAVALGIDYLAGGTGLHRSTVVESRKRLVELGYLVSEGTGRRGLALFTITTGRPAATCRAGATCRPETTSTCRPAATGTSSVAATQTETGNIETTTLSENDGFPTSGGDTKPTSEPQGNQTLSPTPSRSKSQSAKVTWDGARIIVPDAFMNSWGEAYPSVDLRMSIKRASSWCLSNPGKRPKKDFARFLNAWFRNVKPSDPEHIDPKEQAAEDADLIRQAEESFPDADERADFFYQRSLHGLRVPPGVDCRPMPAEKEVAV